MSIDNKKVLHLDRNDFYGGESASLNLKQLWARFRPDDKKIPENLGSSKNYCVDLCPKFIMARGDLVKILMHTKVTRQLQFRSVLGSYVVKSKKPHKVPSTAKEALSSGLMGMFQKRRFKNFLTYTNNWNADDEKTHSKFDINKQTCAELFKKYGLDANTQAFTGHALALYQDDSYLTQPAYEMVHRCKLYANSVNQFGNSPYIYPVWGLGGLPEGFAYRSAMFGGVYMLNRKVGAVEYDDDGKVAGVVVEGKRVKCKQVIGDPSYFKGTDKVKSTGKIARCICIMDHDVARTNQDSAQIILPSKHTGRKTDMYISVVSYFHKIAAQGRYIAVCSAEVESKDCKNAETELKPALDLLGKIDYKFSWLSDVVEPTNDSSKDNVFITKTYDATTHFESATRQVLEMYKNLTGKEFDLEKAPKVDDLGKDQ